MKRITAIFLFILSSVFTALAQMPQAIDAWTAYPAVHRDGGDLILLQTSFLVSNGNVEGQPNILKLDAVCRNGKLYRVALETNTPVSRRAIHFSGAVPTTVVSFQSDDSAAEVQSWAVLDDGYTVSPYAEVFHGKKNRSWIERLAGTDVLVLELHGSGSEELIHARFRTTGISKALTSVGCTY